MALGIGGTQARADGLLDFTLKNRIGVTILSVYVSPHQVENWEEDVLGVDTLADGQNVRIRFNSFEESRGDLWDIKVVDSNNNSYVWRNLNLRQINEVTVYISGGQVVASSQ